MADAASAGAVVLHAPAKLNLHLGIYPGRDARGYHRADSLMLAVGLADLVSIAPAERLRLLTSEDLGIAPERNTAFRAARELCRAFGRAEGYEIAIEKHIPAQSGMGGASSDAAAVLLGLCQLWGVDARDERVHAVAAGIGADVPFFLTLDPALLTGVGDVLQECFPALEGVPVVLVRPSEGVSTPAAYQAFDEHPSHPASPEALCAALRAGDAQAVAEHLFNNLEPAANELVPVTREVRQWLEAQPGVRAAQLTGSGSCVFAFCEDDAQAALIARRAQTEQKWWSCATTTVGAGTQFC
jgi:4-diphosphocytidyl-2-C-methyl-D-erythritol kinase